jgi:hypothetical protein
LRISLEYVRIGAISLLTDKVWELTSPEWNKIASVKDRTEYTGDVNCDPRTGGQENREAGNLANDNCMG